MKTKTSKLQSAENAAKQVRNLMNAVAQINGIKCPLTTKQIEKIINGIGDYQKIYVSKVWGTISFEEPTEENPSICIRISRWCDEDRFIVGLI